MMSEKNYWIILIVAFTGIALLIWFWLIPCEIVEYNLGVNLFTSSIFMVLTIAFLSWFVTLRERIQWKTVEDEAYYIIQENLSTIFDGILNIVEKGIEIRTSFLNIEDEENRNKAFFTELCKLKDAKEIEINPLMLKAFLVDRESLETFLSVAKQLGDIQIKYSRFLDPQLTIALMKIQRSIFLLERTSYLYSLTKKTSEEMKMISEELREKFLEIMLSEDIYSKSVSLAFKELIEQIYNLHNMGIELRYV